MVFLKVKEFPLHLYVESRDLEWSWRVEGGGPALVDFFGAETGVTRPSPLDPWC